MRISIVVVLLLTFIASSGYASPANFTSDSYGFAIYLPETWERVADKKAGLAISSVLATGDDYVLAIIMVNDLPKQFRKVTIKDFNDKDKEEFFTGILANLKKDSADVEVYSKGSTVTGGKDALWINYEGTILPEPGTVRVYSVYVLANGKAYTISCIAKPDKFGNYTAVFNKIINSFTLI